MKISLTLSLIILLASNVYSNAIDSMNVVLSQINYLNHEEKANAYIDLGNAHFYLDGSIDSALLYFEEAAERYRKVGNQHKCNEADLLIADMNREKGLYSDALKKYLLVLKKSQNIGDSLSNTASLNGVAIINTIQQNFDEAYSYFVKVENIYLESANELGLAGVYNNLGLLFSNQRLTDSALVYYNKSIDYYVRLNDQRNIAISYGNIGLLHLYRQYNPELAKEKFLRSLAIFRSLKDNNNISITLNYMTMALLNNEEYQACLDTAKTSLDLAIASGNIYRQKEIYQMTYEAYNRLGNYQLALESHLNFVNIKDSLNANVQIKEITELQLNYEFDKQRDLDVLKQEMINKEFDDTIKFQYTVISIISVSLVLLMLLIYFIWKTYKANVKAKLKIDDQHFLLEQKSEAITDSIIYAKRIQAAILPSKTLINKFVDNFFLLYKPKDIVAGDFYWYEEADGVTYFAVADCTGHGVPGAMVSVICNNGLNKALKEQGRVDPGDILDATKQIVVEQFSQNEDDVSDGMDIGLISIEKVNNQTILKYAGAYIPLWLIRDKEIIEFKANKQPIGKFGKKEKFQTQVIEIKKGDLIYLSSDGFQDQFGGERGKKMKSIKLKSILLDSHCESMQNQRTILNDFFEDWKGNLDQVDDVCIAGIRF